ncbi:alkaline phosphatase family protein [Haloprofundus salilacus]|uniref:alkaline phosphatase family protein n=1 Tax=Haloprofundus salilacus TaxID=2876190 RepID=UPI001CCAA203|nr:alkaline phosphatase family protein [Haloprofundus salilacus]
MVRESNTVRTLLIGLDAACLPVLDPLFEDGALPALRSVFEEGTAGPLASQVPPWTPSAWPSVYTGVNPGKHGVFGFLRFEGYDWDVVNASDVKARTLWEYLDEAGLTSVVVNAPVTHPPPEIDGAVVPGYIAPEAPDCHPAGLMDDLRDELGEYRVYAPPDAGETTESRIETYRELVRMRGEAFRYLADRFAPEFGFVQFQQTDTVFHECPGDDEAVRAVYEAVDRELAGILDACDPDTVVVVSDHGIGEYRGGEVRVNEQLAAHGFLETRRGGEGMPSWNRIATERLRPGTDGDDGIGDGTVGSDATTALLSTLARVGLTSQRLGRVLSRLGLASFVLRHVPSSAVEAASEQVDFPASSAYLRSRIELGVRVNLAGREPSGVVPESEYEAVRSALVDCLRATTTDEGDPVFERVARREAFFEGPYVEDAPDVVAVPADYNYFLTARLRGDVFDPDPQESWNHKFEGVVALAGGDVDTAAPLDGASLFDVAPTVLSTLGVPYDERMDGEPLAPVTAVGPRTYPSYDAETHRATADRVVETRLSDLGYLER